MDSVLDCYAGKLGSSLALSTWFSHGFKVVEMEPGTMKLRCLALPATYIEKWGTRSDIYSQVV